jgi:hypothetical protein
MKNKIISICLISIFLVSLCSFNVAALGINLKKENNNKSENLGAEGDIDLIFGELYENEELLPMPYIEPFGTGIAISYLFYNAYGYPTGEFDVAFFWNDDTEPFYTKTCDLGMNQVSLMLAGSIPKEELPNKEEYPELQIKMKLDYNDEIEETNDGEDAEENNIAVSNTIDNPKLRLRNKPVLNLLQKHLDKFPVLHRLIAKIL